MAVYKATDLLGQIVAIKKKSKLDKEKIIHLLIQPDSGNVLGGVGRHNLFSFSKISSQPKKAMEIKVKPLEEEDKEIFNSLLSEKIFLLKARVETESGHYLGKVIDFEFDDISWRVERIFVTDRSLFRALATQLQIVRDDILSVNKRTVIVRDGLVKRESDRKSQAGSEYVGVGSGATLLEK